MVLYHVHKAHREYFARDRMLRHTFQHFEIAICVAILLYLVLGIQLHIYTAAILILFTYLPDLDGISSCFLWYRTNPIAKGVADRLLAGKVGEALLFGTKYHKQLNRLVFHNYVFYPILWGLFFWSLGFDSYLWTIAFSALIGHFTFDWCDDIFQMGNVKNWLWPYHFLFPKWHMFDPNKITYAIPQMHKHMTADPIDYLFRHHKKD
jgi:hypothetical protein